MIHEALLNSAEQRSARPFVEPKSWNCGELFVRHPCSRLACVQNPHWDRAGIYVYISFIPTIYFKADCMPPSWRSIRFAEREAVSIFFGVSEGRKPFSVSPRLKVFSSPCVSKKLFCSFLARDECRRILSLYTFNFILTSLFRSFLMSRFPCFRRGSVPTFSRMHVVDTGYGSKRGSERLGKDTVSFECPRFVDAVKKWALCGHWLVTTLQLLAGIDDNRMI